MDPGEPDLERLHAGPKHVAANATHTARVRRPSWENIRPTSLAKPPPVDLFQRPLSALARHKVHELSDIREVSGSSKGGTVRKTQSGVIDGKADRKTSLLSSRFDAGSGSIASAELATADVVPVVSATPPRGLTSRAPSALSLPMADVPARRSSASFLNQSIAGSRQGSMQDFPSWKLPAPQNGGEMISPRGPADSPVRAVAAKDAISSDALRTSPSRTFIRTVPPTDILDHGSSRHPRVELRLRLPSPLFVGGGTAEGWASLVVDAGASRRTKLKPIAISKLSIDVIGVEEVSDGRRWIFLSLATELFDERHPPPPSMVVSPKPPSGPELFWELKPATTTLPFCVNLPLNLGPPPFVSRQGSIRYLLCPTVVVKVGDKKSVIRQIWDVQMLTVHDPEKALASLPSPLLASDRLVVASGLEAQSVKLTAGLHRQTWVNGADIFVDVHVVNHTCKPLKKIDTQMEKVTLWYSHAAAGTAEKSASHLRLPRKSDSELVSHSSVKKSKEWSGVLPNSSEVRTCKIHAPRGHVTISTGRYFEVRYFLTVSVAVTMFKSIAVQLPITLIHMNSLDILPNSLAQVAASIESKRARTVPVAPDAPIYPRYHQGQAFTAPGRHSLERGKSVSVLGDHISDLTHELENSPRRHGNGQCHHHGRKSTMSTAFSRDPESRPSGVPSSHHHHLHRPSCYHCHITCDGLVRNPSTGTAPTGPKLPRLQVSTSGLGFSESEFEVPPDSPPKKVMLSESERKLIQQQRELRLQREYSQKQQENARKEKARKRELLGVDADGAKEKMDDVGQDGYWGWKNVAAPPNAGPKMPDYGNRSSFHAVPVKNNPHQSAWSMIPGPSNGPGPARTRSRTNPEHMGIKKASGPGLGPGSGPSGARSHHRRGQRSFDRPGPSSLARLAADGAVFGHTNEFTHKPRRSTMERPPRKRSLERLARQERRERHDRQHHTSLTTHVNTSTNKSAAAEENS